MSTITWLHISDLHWRQAWAYDENVVAQALLRDLEEQIHFLRYASHRAVVLKRFGPYREFVNQDLDHVPFDSMRYFYVAQRPVGGKRVAVLCLNSAWSASDRNHLQLFLRERQVRAALDHANARDADRRVCPPLLLQNGHFVLHGHVH